MMKQNRNSRRRTRVSNLKGEKISLFHQRGKLHFNTYAMIKSQEIVINESKALANGNTQIQPENACDYGKLRKLLDNLTCLNKNYKKKLGVLRYNT